MITLISTPGTPPFLLRFSLLEYAKAAKRWQLGGNGGASLNAAENDFPIEICTSNFGFG